MATAHRLVVVGILGVCNAKLVEKYSACEAANEVEKPVRAPLPSAGGSIPVAFTTRTHISHRRCDSTSPLIQVGHFCPMGPEEAN